MKTYTLSNDKTFTFRGEVLGFGSSQDAEHRHPATRALVRGEKCSACRWQEVTLYLTDEEDFVVHSVGRTTIPGEVDFVRLTRTDSAFTLLEVLTVHRNDGTFLPRPCAYALTEAAAVNEDIRDAWINRAVV